MTYQKKQPKIMSDGNIARVGMIVYHNSGVIGIIQATKTGKSCITPQMKRVIKLEDNEVFVYYPDTNTFSRNPYLIRKATLEEKKQYWAELAQK